VTIGFGLVIFFWLGRVAKLLWGWDLKMGAEHVEALPPRCNQEHADAVLVTRQLRLNRLALISPQE
jgi:hypothetical protein